MSQEIELTAKQVQDHEVRIERRLGVVYRREGLLGLEFDVCDNRSPLSELLEREAHEEGRLARDEIEPEQYRNESFDRMMAYFFADGPHPGCVLRRVFATALALPKARKLICNMTQTDVAILFDEKKASQSWRVKKIFSGYLKSAGNKGFKAVGQKTESSTPSYRKSAKRSNEKRKRRAGFEQRLGKKRRKS